MNEQTYRIALTLIPLVGGHTAKLLLSYCGSASAIFKTPAKSLRKIPGIGQKTIDAILAFQDFEQAEKIYTHAEKNKINLIFYTDEAYPKRLKEIHHSPFILYFQGNTDLNASRMISIVGTRKASQFGKEFTAQLIKKLTPYQVTVISGLAYGIDISAHQACLHHNTPTIGVMANGSDMIYPSAHHHTAQQMMTNGGVLTEYPYGTPPDQARFPARNRIIAGMADATIVIEANKKGGALITANFAADFNRDVFAVPGAIHSSLSIGCNNLIKQHKAHLLSDAKDIAYIMNWSEETSTSKKATPLFDFTSLSTNETKIIQFLLEQNQSMLIDEISWSTELHINQTACTLLEMEMKDLVKSLPGNKYTLK